MKKLQTGIGALLGGLLLLTPSAQHPVDENPQVVVGTFDSRAVLFAFVGSNAFETEMGALRAELEHAQAEGDAERVAELEARGPELQAMIHRQGFGTAPVDDIIARIEDALPGIAKEAGVDVIVSKWTLAYTGPGAKFVDVTDLLAAEFDPDEETWKGIHEIVATDPVPLDQLTEDH